jgi:hypothetical protein
MLTDDDLRELLHETAARAPEPAPLDIDGLVAATHADDNLAPSRVSRRAIGLAAAAVVLVAVGVVWVLGRGGDTQKFAQVGAAVGSDTTAPWQ